MRLRWSCGSRSRKACSTPLRARTFPKYPGSRRRHWELVAIASSRLRESSGTSIHASPFPRRLLFLGYAIFTNCCHATNSLAAPIVPPPRFLAPGVRTTVGTTSRGDPVPVAYSVLVGGGSRSHISFAKVNTGVHAHGGVQAQAHREAFGHFDVGGMGTVP